ncbi:hypothetical protein ALQ16_203618 [Pseudomonas syringae pv. actinidiae]|nr:hypothetical protein ALQ16_203618 [Pseudomonas syringae pv. actinidiae]
MRAQRHRQQVDAHALPFAADIDRIGTQTSLGTFVEYRVQPLAQYRHQRDLHKARAAAVQTRHEIQLTRVERGKAVQLIADDGGQITRGGRRQLQRLHQHSRGRQQQDAPHFARCSGQRFDQRPGTDVFEGFAAQPATQTWRQAGAKFRDPPLPTVLRRTATPLPGNLLA